MRTPHRPDDDTPKRPNPSEDALQSAQYRRFLRQEIEEKLGHFKD